MLKDAFTHTDTQKNTPGNNTGKDFSRKFQIQVVFKKEIQIRCSPPLGRGASGHMCSLLFSTRPIPAAPGSTGSRSGGPQSPRWAPLILLSCWDGAWGRVLGRDVAEGHNSRANQSPADPPRSKPVCCSPAEQHPKEMEPFHPPRMPPQFVLRTQNTRWGLSTS